MPGFARWSLRLFTANAPPELTKYIQYNQTEGQRSSLGLVLEATRVVRVEENEKVYTMPTETITLEERQRKPRDSNLPPEDERYLRACSDIASFLVQEHEASQEQGTSKKDVNLNSLRAKMSKKHRLSNIPPLTAIIAAIPENYKKYILPKLVAKPISTYCL